MSGESFSLCHRMEACYPTLSLYVAALQVIPRTRDKIFLFVMPIGFEIIGALSCSFGAADEGGCLPQEDELEVDSDRCIMTYMGKSEGGLVCL
jgi:hypothetical protein